MDISSRSGGGAATVRAGRGRRRLTILAMVSFLLSLLIQYSVAPVAAVHDEGIFELDGNAVDQAAVAGDDWQNGTPGASDTLFIPGSVEKDGADTSYFKGGGSKDHHDISDWAWSGTDVAPDKDELLDVFASVYEAQAGTIVYFGADKFDDSGDAQIGYWFFQNNVSTKADGTFNGVHKNGDVLILSDFTNGGAVSRICVYEWNPPGADTNIDNSKIGCDIGDNVTLVAAGTECDVSTPDGAFDVCAVVNAQTETAPWAFTNKDGDHSFAEGQFFEGGINLSTLFGGDAPCFSTFLAETRSSQEVEAQLKDFALGSLDTCVPPDLTTDSSVSKADFGAKVTDQANLSGIHGPVTGTIQFYICGPADDTSAGCTIEDNAHKVGSPVTIANDKATSPEYTVGSTAAAAGTYCWRAKYTPASDSEYLPTSHTDADSECFEVAPAAIHVAKEADDASVSAGDQIGFTVTISNTGANTALGISFSDSLPSGTGVSWSLDAANSDAGWAVTGSAPNQQLTFSPTSLAGKTSTKAHVVSATTASSCGAYDNSASVSTTNDGQGTASDSTFVECPGLAIDKVDNTGSFDAVDDVISYSIKVTNTGNVTLTDVVVTDPNAVGLDCLPDAGNQTTIPSLAAGAFVICSASHTVTQADLDAGHYFNQACADDNNGDGEAGANPVCDDVDTPGEQNPALDIVKSDGDSTYSNVGDVIHYTIKATNIGNVTLHDVVVTDPKASNLQCTPATPVASLAVGAEINCTASHKVTQADLDAGHYANQACTDDGNGDGATGAAPVCDDVDTPGDQNPALDIVKSDGDATYDAVGDVINYTIVATNTGNVTLHNVVVTDPNVSNLVCLPSLPVGSLAPGAQITCTASHTVTQEDLDNGSYLNTACVNDGEGGAAEECDDEDTPSVPNPVLSIDKVAAETGYEELGDVIHYTITVTNIGNVTLKDVVVTDLQVGDLDCTPDLPVASLAPGASFTCTASHTVVQGDFDLGFFLNEACADDGNGDGDTGADEVCDDVTVFGQQAGGETDAPSQIPSQPPTDGQLGGNGSGPGSGGWLFIVILATGLAALVIVTPNRSRKRS
jgi:uncharacterized repeat protein (TIGR01451 family)